MTDERPVKELIGWAPFYLGTAIIEWLDRQGRARARAGVDDLADWLRRFCESVEIGWLWDDDCQVSPETKGPWCITAVTAHAGILVNAEASTIRDALIAAVRAVHEAQS